MNYNSPRGCDCSLFFRLAGKLGEVDILHIGRTTGGEKDTLMPDDWDYTQKPKRQGDIKAVQPPYLTIMLIALCVVIYGAKYFSGDSEGTLLYHIGHAGYVDTYDIHHGKIYGLFTSFFCHADLLHLAFNMIWLYQMGTILEVSLSPMVYAPFLLAATAIGSGVEILVSGTTGIGASGTVYAMFGLMWAGRGMYPQWRMIANPQNMQIMVGWGLLCIVLTYAHVISIANGAHVGGFIFGLSIGYLFFSIRRKWLWAIPLVALFALTVFAVTKGFNLHGYY